MGLVTQPDSTSPSRNQVRHAPQRHRSVHASPPVRGNARLTFRTEPALVGGSLRSPLRLNSWPASRGHHPEAITRGRHPVPLTPWVHTPDSSSTPAASCLQVHRSAPAGSPHRPRTVSASSRHVDRHVHAAPSLRPARPPGSINVRTTTAPSCPPLAPLCHQTQPLTDALLASEASQAADAAPGRAEAGDWAKMARGEPQGKAGRGGVRGFLVDNHCRFHIRRQRTPGKPLIAHFCRMVI